jgi:CO/xanthine dehydrogenase Mo-binding subunit
MNIDITVNGEAHTVDIEPDTPLLYAIRNDLGLKGTRFGCGHGTCGSCMVLIDGEPVNSCDIPVSEVGTREVRTVENAAEGSALAALQQAFVAEQAAQCGYCTSGVLMSACALLERSPQPTRDEICEALDDNLCRCGTHARMVRAVERAAASDAVALPLAVTGHIGDHRDDGIANEHLSVLGDGTVLMRSGKVDIGQGISTALARIASEALDVAVGRFRIVRTDTAISPNEGMTAGSYSVQQGGAAIRTAAEELRLRLLTLATEDLGSSVDELSVDDGVITAPSGETTTYWELAGGSDRLELDGAAPAGRVDLPGKLAGRPSYIQDLDFDGMVHARLVRPPTQTARLDSVDPSSVFELDGVIEVVRSGSFLAVVTEREEQAIRAARRLSGQATWMDEPAPEFDPGDPTYLLDSDDRDVYTIEGSVPIEKGPDRITATYTRGYLAHGSIGPSCSLARMDATSLTVWTHSQGVYLLRASLGTALGMPEEAIRVIHVEGAGCYGHNGADDAALDAALIAREVPGKTVRLQWSREDEFEFEPYGSAMVVELSATLDDDGKIADWTHRGWSHPHSARPQNTGGVNLFAAQLMENPIEPIRLTPIPAARGACVLRNAVPAYDVGPSNIDAMFVPFGPVRTSALRGLGTQPNTFAIESFMEDLAELAGVDPVEFRIRHLSDPRAIEVIETVVERAGVPVGGQSPEGHGYGLGFGRYKNVASYVAVIAEVAAEREVELVRAWAVVDAGNAVEPDGVLNQIEGGIIQSASWALTEEVRFVDGRPDLHAWLDYPILGFANTPELDVHLIDRPDEPSVGVGEGAAGPTTAAIANAVRAALGVPVRELPLTPERIMKAILT